jgi:hypothetical protein
LDATSYVLTDKGKSAKVECESTIAALEMTGRAELRFAGAATLVSDSLPAIFVLDPAAQCEVLIGREGQYISLQTFVHGREQRKTVALCSNKASAHAAQHVCLCCVCTADRRSHPADLRCVSSSGRRSRVGLGYPDPHDKPGPCKATLRWRDVEGPAPPLCSCSPRGQALLQEKQGFISRTRGKVLGGRSKSI